MLKIMIRKKLFLNFLLLASSLFLTECGNKTQASISTSSSTADLSRFVQDHKIISNMKDSYSILFLYENGCVGCNKSYAKVVEQYINDSATGIVVTAKGTQIDLSPFIRDSTNNVFHDVKKEFLALGITSQSAAIFVRNNKIDTIVSISADSLETKLQFIQEKLHRQ